MRVMRPRAPAPRSVAWINAGKRAMIYVATSARSNSSMSIVIKIVVNDTGACLTGITIQRYNVSHPNATLPIQTGHWWEITPVGCTSGFNVDLTLPADFAPDANDKVCRYVSGTTWDCIMNSFTASSITRNSVTGFSQWAVGNNSGPTAVTLNSLTARGGDASAVPIGFAPFFMLFATVVSVAGFFVRKPRRKA